MSICTATSDVTPAFKPMAVTIRTAQDLLGIKATKVWEPISDGTLERVAIGRRRLVLYLSLEQLIERLRQQETQRPRRAGADSAIKASLEARRARKRQEGRGHLLGLSIASFDTNLS
jgi:hypothetical protein